MDRQIPKRSTSNIDNSLKSVLGNGVHSERGGISWSPEVSGKSYTGKGLRGDFSVPWTFKQPMPSILQQGEKIEDELDSSMSRYGYSNPRRIKSSEDEDEMQCKLMFMDYGSLKHSIIGKYLQISFQSGEKPIQFLNHTYKYVYE